MNFSCRFGIFSWLNYENCIVRVCRKSLRKFIFEQDKVFHQMRLVSVKKSVFARNFSDRIVKSAFNVSIGTFRGKYFLEFTERFSDMNESFGCLSLFSAGLSKQQSTYPEEQFDEKQLFEKRIMFLSFSDSERKISGRLAISFRLSCQNCALDPRRKIWGRKWKNWLLSSFLVFEWKFFGLLSNSLLGFVKIAFYVSMGLFE